MARVPFRRGRFFAVMLVGLALPTALSLRNRGSLLGVALAAGSNPAPISPKVVSLKPAAPPLQAHRVVQSGDDISDVADDPEITDLPGLGQKFQAIARRVAPAVVSISAAQTASDAQAVMSVRDMNPQKLDALLDQTTRTIGTGFIVDPNGFIVTNEHVIEDSQQFWISTDDRKVYPAIVVGADPRADLAVLKIPATNLPTVTFAPGQSRRGQWALTLGNPYGLAADGQMSLSVGVVSAIDRSLPKLASKEDRLYSDLIQTTAQINPGNSGGPLLDVDGRVIGIDTAVILPQKQTNGIGFALPVTPGLLAEIRQLEQGREVIYGYIGVTVSAPTPRQWEAAKLNDDVGVYVESIEPQSPAAGSGLQPGDMIVEVNGQTATDTDRFVRLVGAAPVGQTTAVAISRHGTRKVIHLVPVKRPVQYVVSNQNQRLYWRGMVLGPVPTNWPMAIKSDKHLAGILVVGIDDDSPLKKRGISAGTIITAIAGQPVNSLLDFQKVLNDVPPEKCDVQLADQVVAAQ
jgi:serine protease Do